MYLFTSEVVSPGHPDKCADIIADSIVDEVLGKDKDARLASEVTELLMGSDVAPRRNFIHEHAREAVIDA